MFRKPINIQEEDGVTDIVIQDYRTSRVFRKYGIDFCCGGRKSLRIACDAGGLNIETVKAELADITRVTHISSSTNFANWDIDFLIDYVINIHHSYLVNNLPDIIDTVDRFLLGHGTKFPHLKNLTGLLEELKHEVFPHIEQENQIIFPYIKQIVHAYESREAYASLLVRTLRKPVENMIFHDDRYIGNYLRRMRELTDNYTPPERSCVTHKVAFAKLNELDQDLVQHIHLENNVLFPKAIAMEKELLENIPV